MQLEESREVREFACHTTLSEATGMERPESCSSGFGSLLGLFVELDLIALALMRGIHGAVSGAVERQMQATGLGVTIPRRQSSAPRRIRPSPAFNSFFFVCLAQNHGRCVHGTWISRNSGCTCCHAQLASRHSDQSDCVSEQIRRDPAGTSVFAFEYPFEKSSLITPPKVPEL